MSKNVGYIGGGVLVFVSLCFLGFGAMFFFASYDPVRGLPAWRTIGLSLSCVGLLLTGGGIAMVIAAYRKAKAEMQQNVTVQVDLPADMNVEKMKCQSCGGVLTAKDITLVNGAPMVTCPFCGTVYQLSEEPKW